MIELGNNKDKFATCSSCSSTKDIRSITVWSKDGLKITIRLCDWCRRVLITKIVEDFKA